MERMSKEAFAAEWRERFQTKQRLDISYVSGVPRNRKQEIKQWQRWLLRRHNSPLPEEVKQELTDWLEWFTKEELPGGMWPCVIAYAMWKDAYFEAEQKRREENAAREREAGNNGVTTRIMSKEDLLEWSMLED